MGSSFHLPRNAQLWLPGYLKSSLQRRGSRKPSRAWLMFADHFEPWSLSLSRENPPGIVERWRSIWPEIAMRHRDSSGMPPCYTFFYPEEQYQPNIINPLAEMTRQGIADVEIHIHHGGEGEAVFCERMRKFIELLYHRHGLLRMDAGKIVFGFIHGNWALDNSCPDGRWCGLNNELTLLRELGCYADFTLPSAPSPAQTRTVNSIYWATDDPLKPKSHDAGVPVRPGEPAAGDLLIVQGPLCLNQRGQSRWLPRLETGELSVDDPPLRGRAASWIDAAPCIDDDAFIKVFTHGAQPRNANTLLEGGLDLCLEDFRTECSRRNMEFYFVSAWQMRVAIEAVRLQLDPRDAVRSVSNLS
jgi:hypothetical protein